MNLVFDAGGLIALERGEQLVWALYKNALARDDRLVTNAAVLGQVWRGGPRQARLSLALVGIDVRPVDEEMGRAAGKLLGSARTSDLLDATVILLAHDGDGIITSGPGDLEPLAAASGRHVELVHP